MLSVIYQDGRYFILLLRTKVTPSPALRNPHQNICNVHRFTGYFILWSLLSFNFWEGWASYRAMQLISKKYLSGNFGVHVYQWNNEGVVTARGLNVGWIISGASTDITNILLVVALNKLCRKKNILEVCVHAQTWHSLAQNQNKTTGLSKNRVAIPSTIIERCAFCISQWQCR